MTRQSFIHFLRLKWRGVLGRMHLAARWVEARIPLVLMRVDYLFGRKIIMVDAFEPQYIPFCRPIVEMMRARGMHVSIYGVTQDIYFGKPMIGVYDVSRPKWIRQQNLHIYNIADVYLAASIYGNAAKSVTRIQMFHNQPVKHVSYPERFINYFNYFFTMGPRQEAYIKDMISGYANICELKKFIPVGYPKIDPLFQMVECRDLCNQKLGLDPNRKTILYAPSWDEGLSLREFGVQLIEALSHSNWNVIVRLHPASMVPKNHPRYVAYTGGVDWANMMQSLLVPSCGLFSTHEDPAVVLAASDLMITDNSSVAFEYIVLDRPMVFFDCPKFYEETLQKNYVASRSNVDPVAARSNPLLNGGRDAGVVVASVDECMRTVERELAHPSGYHAPRNLVMQEMLYNPGRATEVAVNEIKEILQCRNNNSAE
jgi:CDP-glycerol glycerophosphotransferase (TagB/SpsB family)